MSNFKSQFNQDRNVLEIYNFKKNGFFIEIGAYDGIDSSNTYVLEKEYNWNGLCVECNPIYYNNLSNSRNCYKSNNAVYNEDGREMEFYDSGGYAGLVETNNHQHIVNHPKIKVYTKKLTTLLDEISAPSFIEYLSLDTEGSEYEILKAHDFNKYKIGYICVEHNSIEHNRLAIRELLESKGYRFKRDNGDSYWGVIDDEYILIELENKLLKEKNQININVLFLNHMKTQCGVYNYGIRLYDIWKKSKNIKFIYKEINSLDEYQAIDFKDFKCIFYNFHTSTMPWLNNTTIQRSKSKNIGILHESDGSVFDYCLNTDSDIPRPIFENIPKNIETYNEDIINFLDFGINSNIPIIGSFGFGFTNKGFDKIVKYVNEQFDEAIIKIVMPYAYFGDNSGEISKYVESLCILANSKPGIKIMIIHDFLSDNDILYFLSKNTINLFLYDLMLNRGLSSTIDFALSVDRPLGISDSYMFRHIYNDSICVYKNTIKSCINNNLEYINNFKNKMSHTNSIIFIEKFMLYLLKNMFNKYK